MADEMMSSISRTPSPTLYAEIMHSRRNTAGMTLPMHLISSNNHTPAALDAGDDNPPPSPSSASLSDGAPGGGGRDGGDGDGFADGSPSFSTTTTARNGLQRRTTLTSSRHTTTSSMPWHQPRGNTNPHSPANLPHEILSYIFTMLFTRTSGHHHARNCLLVCRSWALAAVELLWLRPGFFHLPALCKLILTIRAPEQTFPYVTLIRRLNFSGMSTELTDQLFGFMSDCCRLERLALADCSELSEDALISTLSCLTALITLDLTNVTEVTDKTLEAIARNCKRLQGVNLTNCKNITSRGVAALGNSCPILRRIKLCGCELVGDEGVLSLVLGCPMLMEIDLYNCRPTTDRALRQMWINSSHLRELRLANCGVLTDLGFPASPRMLTSSAAALDLSCTTSMAMASIDHLNSAIGQLGSESAPTSRGASPLRGGDGRDGVDDSSRHPSFHDRLSPGGLARATVVSLSKPLKPPRTFEHLRILDLTNCNTISDDAIEGIIVNAPRIRNLGLSKCTRLTDASIYSLSKLGKNLQYLHLGHVSNITDRGMRHLVDHCTRIRYLDLANCTQLTDLCVMELAVKLTKLKRIGLVRVHHITDNALYALVERHLNLQRIHLSYCNKISVAAVFWLLERLPKVTHISLTGVTAFQRPELQAMCRPPPDEFSPTQRESFCVYSGQGVVDLQQYLRGVYSSEDSARQFTGENGELTTEDHRAIHLMREKAERNRPDRRTRYLRTDPTSSYITSGSAPIAALSPARSTAAQMNYPRPGGAAPSSYSSRFPLSHITTSSTFTQPRQLNLPVNGNGTSADISAMDVEDGEEDEDFPLAPHTWTNTTATRRVVPFASPPGPPQPWPPGVSSPDLAQLDPRAWSSGAEQGRGASGVPAPSLPLSAPRSVLHSSSTRSPLLSSLGREGVEAVGLPANAAIGQRNGIRPTTDGSPTYHAASSSTAPFMRPSAVQSDSGVFPIPQPYIRDPNNWMIIHPVPATATGYPTTHSASDRSGGARFEEPVYARGGGGRNGGTAIGSSSRSSSSSAPLQGQPTSDSSVATYNNSAPPPPAAGMTRSSAASGVPAAGNGAESVSASRLEQRDFLQHHPLSPFNRPFPTAGAATGRMAGAAGDTRRSVAINHLMGELRTDRADLHLARQRRFFETSAANVEHQRRAEQEQREKVMRNARLQQRRASDLSLPASSAAEIGGNAGQTFKGSVRHSPLEFDEPSSVTARGTVQDDFAQDKLADAPMADDTLAAFSTLFPATPAKNRIGKGIAVVGREEEEAEDEEQEQEIEDNEETSASARLNHVREQSLRALGRQM